MTNPQDVIKRAAGDAAHALAKAAFQLYPSQELTMKHLLRYFLLTVMSTYLIVSNCYGGSQELAQLIENKNFWSDYKWGILEDSELYLSTKWALIGSGGYSNITTSQKYSAETNVDDENVKANLDVDIKDNNSITNRLLVNWLNSSTSKFDRIVIWCDNKFGNIHDENTVEKDMVNYIRITKTVSWKLGNTTVEVSVYNKLCQSERHVLCDKADDVFYDTRLTFRRNLK